MTDFTRKVLLSLLLIVATPAVGADIWLFRHAEKAEGKDPSLTAAGAVRAQELASIILKKTPGEQQLWLYSSDYWRTRETLSPLAKASGQAIRLYDPRQLEALATEILALEGTVVVAGHSNTTPKLVNLLSGHEVTIAEDSFDQLFHLTPSEAGFLLEELSSNPH